MRDLLRIGFHHGRRIYKTFNSIRYEIVKDDIGRYYDVTEKPFSIYIIDTKKKLSLYSTTLFQFATKEEAKNFCEYIIKNDLVDELMELLIDHHYDISTDLEQRCPKDTKAFEERLSGFGMTLSDLKSLVEEYRKLPTYLKKFLDFE